MGGLIEVVFDGLDARTAVSVTQHIIELSRAPPRQVAVDAMDVPQEIPIAEVVQRMEHVGYVRLAGFALEGLGVVPDVGIRVLRVNEGLFDVEMNMNEADVPDLSRVGCALHEFAMSVAKRFSVRNYYGGVEPAGLEEETRFFTGEARGPFEY